MATTIDAVFTSYKVWPSAAPVGSGATFSWDVPAVAVEMATTTHTADVDVAAYNFDDQSVIMTVEIDSAFGAALFNNLWGAGSGAGSGGSTNLSLSRSSTTFTIVSDTGADATVPAATDTQAGALTAAMKTKLDGIEAGAQVNPTAAAIVALIDSELGSADWQTGGGAVDLANDPDADSVVLTIGGSPVTDILAATATDAGVMSAADKVKLNGIEAGAEVNYTEDELIALLGEPLGAKGTFLVPPTVAVSSNGTVVTATVGSGSAVFSDGTLAYAGGSTSLTAGSNTAPTANYIYLLHSDSSVHANTTGWPATEHVPLAVTLIQGAASVQSEGPYGLLLIDAYTKGATTAVDGKLVELTKNDKAEASWVSGMDLTTTITANGADDDDIDLALAAGTFLRGRTVTFPARDSAGSDQIYLYNSSAAAYTKVGTLKTALKTNSLGGVVASGQYVSLFVWASVSETASISKIMANLPSAFYPSEKAAIADSHAYTDYDVPVSLRHSCIPVARVVFAYTSAGSGTWTLVYTQDLRGKSISQLENGVPASNEFLDSEFKVRDETDPTKVVAFQASGVTSGATRTLTVPNASGTITLLEVAQAFAAGAKKTFSHNGTTAGLRFEPIAGDPSAPEDGDVWYNSSTGKLRKRQNGVTEDLDTQGSAAPGGSDNQFTYNNGGAFGGSSGLTYNESDNRAVVANGLEINEATTPTAPSANKAVLFLHDRGIGKAFPSVIDQYGDAYPLGNSGLQSKTFGILKARANSGTPADLFHGVTAINNGSAVDVTTGAYGRRHKMAYTSVAATLNSSAGFRAGIRSFFREGGFYWRCRWSPSTAHDTLSGQTRGFWGVANTTAALSGATDFSSQVNIIGFGWDAGQTTLRAGCNDGSGAATTTDLGVNFPINTVDTDVYDVALFCDPADTTQVFYFVERVNTGNTASGSFTTNLPAVTTGLGAQGWSAQGNQSATAIVCHFYYSYWELPY